MADGSMKNNSLKIPVTFVATSSEAIAIQLTLCVVLLIATAISNGTICFLVVHLKALTTVPNVLLANLAFVELLNSSVNITLYMVYDLGNKKSLVTSSVAWWMVCLTILFILLNLTSMLILVVDRYFAIAHTLKYYTWKSLRRALLAVIVAWISTWIPVMGGAVSLYNVELGTKSLYYYRTFYVTKTNCKYYIVPVIATLIIAIAKVTVLTLREIRKTKQPKSNSVALRRNNGRIEQTNAKSASTILLTFLYYTVCKISALCFILIATNVSSLNQLQSQWLYFLANCLIFCSSSCNGFIYADRSSNFRLGLKKIRKTFICYRGIITPLNHNQQGKQEGLRAFYIKGTFGEKRIRYTAELITTTATASTTGWTDKSVINSFKGN